MIISRGFKRLMAYIYMPLIFTILGFLLIYIAFEPIINIGISLTSMIMAQEIPDFNLELESIYVEPEDVVSEKDTIADNLSGEDKNEEASDEGVTNEDTSNNIPPNINENDTNTTLVGEVVWPSYGQHYAQIYCKRIGLEAPLYMGDGNAIMKVGAGQYMGSFPPGYGRIILVGAHCTTFFRPLQYVETGDIFVVKTSYGIYKYKVSKTQVYKANDKSAYDLSENKEQLVLYTCYPFRLLSGSRKQRIFVYADKISGPSIK